MKPAAAIGILALVSTLPGCAKPYTATVGAPEDALRCAMQRAAAAGYRPYGGGLEDGYLQLHKDTYSTRHYLTLSSAGSALTVDLRKTSTAREYPESPSKEEVANAEVILRECGSR